MTPARNVSGFSKLCLVLTVLLFSIGESSAFSCYNCLYRPQITTPENDNCLKGKGIERRDETCSTSKCMTQIQTGGSGVLLLIRGCHVDQKEGCSDMSGDRVICTYLCTGDLCNTKVYEPPPTTAGPPVSTTPVFPVACFNCGFEEGEEDTNYCRVVKDPTNETVCDLRKCFTSVHVLVGDGNQRNLTSMRRGCGGQEPSICSGDSKNYTCNTICTGHLCNNEPLLVLPNGPGQVNGQTTTSPNVAIYMLYILLVSLLVGT